MAQRMYGPTPGQLEVHRGEAGATMTYGSLGGGALVVADRDVAAAKRAGAVVPGTSMAVVGGSGFWCNKCRFRSVFRKCGRCGGDCER